MLLCGNFVGKQDNESDSLTRKNVAKDVDFTHSEGAFWECQRDAVVLESLKELV